jgi:hypothetical protein
MAELEPSAYRVTIEDPTDPAASRFLHVLQGADAGVSPTTATLLHSASDTTMDGTVIGQTAMLFAEDATVAFVGTSCTVPAGVNQQYVTGCVPGAFYSVTVTTNSRGSVVAVCQQSPATCRLTPPAFWRSASVEWIERFTLAPGAEGSVDADSLFGLWRQARRLRHQSRLTGNGQGGARSGRARLQAVSGRAGRNEVCRELCASRGFEGDHQLCSPAKPFNDGYPKGRPNCFAKD